MYEKEELDRCYQEYLLNFLHYNFDDFIEAEILNKEEFAISIYSNNKANLVENGNKK